MLYQYVKGSFAAASLNATKDFSMSQKNSVIRTTNDYYILNSSMTYHNKKLLQKSLNKKQKVLSSLQRNYNLFAFASN